MNCPRCGDYMLDRKNAEPFCNRCNYETAAARGDVVTVTNCPHGRDGRHCRECECNVCPELLPNPSNCPQPCKRCGGPRTPIEGAPSVLECAACTALLNAKRPNCPPSTLPTLLEREQTNCPHGKDPAKYGCAVCFLDGATGTTAAQRHDAEDAEHRKLVEVLAKHVELVRALATCTHPAQRIHGDSTARTGSFRQWCSECGARRLYVDGRPSAWRSHRFGEMAMSLDGEAGPSGAPAESSASDSEKKNDT